MKPADYRPQKALLVDEPPTGAGWIHEIKLDGFRMGVFIGARTVHIISRRGTDYTAHYPEIVAAARELTANSAVLDGEVVVLDEHGLSNFQLLQHVGTAREGLAYFAFDLLSLNGEDLTKRPLHERKHRLRKLLGARAGTIRYAAHVDTNGADVFAKACALGAEGIISKLRDGPYRMDSRSPDWQKIKCVKRQEFVVGGFTDPEGSRVGVGSMLIGYYERGALRFAGKVGTGRGWSAEFGRTLRRKLESIEVARPAFQPPPRGWLGSHAHWVTPKLVAEIEFSEWTADDSVRHPSFQGFRTDKLARSVVREREVRLSNTAARNKAADEAAVAAEGAIVVYPRLALSTHDLATLYTEMADWVMPHVERRPLTLVRMRAPITRDDALRTQATFVRHTARDQNFVPNIVPRAQIRELKKTGQYCYVDSPKALVALIGAGVVEWHTWNARIDDVERPDRVVFDLDPGKGVPWAGIVAAARRLRSVLETHNLESWVKTSGGSGLHVVVPFRREHDWQTVFEFSRNIAKRMAHDDPDTYTVSFDKRARPHRVLIDYKRNHRASIAVAAFSIRARPHAPLSVPLRWEELGRTASGDRWTVTNIRDRLRRLAGDPWKEFWTTRQRLTV